MKQVITLFRISIPEGTNQGKIEELHYSLGTGLRKSVLGLRRNRLEAKMPEIENHPVQLQLGGTETELTLLGELETVKHKSRTKHLVDMLRRLAMQIGGAQRRRR